MTSSQLWRVQIRLNYKATEAAVRLLENMDMHAVSWFECEDAAPSSMIDDQGFPIAEEFFVEGYTKSQPNAAELEHHLITLAQLLSIEKPSVRINEVDNTDWLTACYQSLAPRQIGRYYVYGSHTPDPSDYSMVPLKVDAATAFGSGEHQSTSGCLLALDQLAKTYQFKKMLDMGCGSGILAIAMAKTWPEGAVVAADNDPESVRVAEQNMHLNNCEDHVKTLLSHGFDSEYVRDNGPYDIIVANILAKPLCLMAADMKKSLHSGGIVVLSGLLENQKEMVMQAYTMQGLSLVTTHPIGQWTTLVLKTL